MKDNLLTIKEVADYLRVSERSVLRYIEVGTLKNREQEDRKKQK